LHYSFLSVMKKNVWHSIEQHTIDISIDQWHSRLKTRICAEGGHFKQMMEIKLRRKRSNILRENLPQLNVFHHFELN